MFSVFGIIRQIHSQHFQMSIRRILANTIYVDQFSWLLVNLCENAQVCRRIFGICLFSAILWELTYAWIQIYIYLNHWSSARVISKVMHDCTQKTQYNHYAWKLKEVYVFELENTLKILLHLVEWKWEFHVNTRGATTGFLCKYQVVCGYSFFVCMRGQGGLDSSKTCETYDNGCVNNSIVRCRCKKMELADYPLGRWWE